MDEMDILKSSQVRVWLIEHKADPEISPSYEYQLQIADISQDTGKRTAKKIPDPYRKGAFVEIDTVAGKSGRVITTLSGMGVRNLLSKLLELAGVGCPFDIQAHAGACIDPQVFEVFDKAMLLENAFCENWEVSPLTTFSGDDNEAVQESLQISAENVYEAIHIYWGERISSIITNEVLDVVYCDELGCSDCGESSNGCSVAFAITKQSAGSPGSPADIIYTDNDWRGAYAYDIDSLHWDEDPSAIDCMWNYVVIVSNDSGSVHYALKSDFENRITPTFTEISTGIVGAPNDIYSLGRKAFVVGDSGYIYSTTDITEGLTVEDAGAATAENLNRIHAISEQFAVAVGDNGAVIWTEDGETWSSATEPTSSNLVSVFIKAQYEWWVGSDDGYLYYSKNQGSTWNVKAFPGYNDGSVHDITFPTMSVGYFTHTTSGGEGRIFRTFNGGFSWSICPGLKSSLPENDRINRLAICEDAVDQIAANHLVAVGLNGSDGILMKGQNLEQFTDQKEGNYLVTVGGLNYIVTESGDRFLVT